MVLNQVTAISQVYGQLRSCARLVLRPPISMLDTLAIRNLIHDRVRLGVTIVGIVFAIVLMNIQLGLLLGFIRTTSGIISHSGVDLWIMAPGTTNVDQAIPIAKRKVTQALAVPGVAQAAEYIVEFVHVKKPDGSAESALIVGFDPTAGFGGPWQVVTGDSEALRRPNAVMIDELYQEKLGVSNPGQVIEINGIRARVVGFTRGVRSFTQSPYVFTSAKNARDYAGLRKDYTKFVLVKLQAGTRIADVRQMLEARVPDAEVLGTSEFAHRTAFYWMFTTGAGASLLIAAVLGLLVGIVVVSQTLYATTMEHLPEFGTLRAIGAPSRFVYGVIVRQAIVSGLIGYAIALTISLVLLIAARSSGPAILLPWQLAMAMLLLTLVMCVGAAMISIKKVIRLEPSVVFK